MSLQGHAPKNPFDYHKPSDNQIEQIAIVRENCKDLNTVLLSLPASRERSIAITKLEETCMWSTKGIIMADEGEIV